MTEPQPQMPGIPFAACSEFFDEVRSGVNEHRQKLEDALARSPDRANSREVDFDWAVIEGERNVLRMVKAFFLIHSVDLTTEFGLDEPQ